MFDYPAHAFCLLFDPRIVVPDVFFNLGIAAAYFAISLVVYQLIRLAPLIPFRSVVWMFMTFILACGVSHITKILTLSYGGAFYVLDLAVCAVTFLASIITALLLLKNGKRLISIIRQMVELNA